MRAVVYERFGPPGVLEVRDVPAPRCGPADVRVRVRAVAINPKDALERKGRVRWATFHRRPPYRVGYDFAGEVAEVGRDVRDVAVGDRVFGMRQGFRAGAAAEELTARNGEYARIPDGVGYEDACAVPLAGQTALQGLRDVGRLRSGQRVCIHGASGGVGLLAVQIARILGAVITTTSGLASFDLLRELGSDDAVTYEGHPVLRRAGAFDVFLDVHGNVGYRRAREALAPGGTYVSTIPGRPILVDTLRTLAGGQRARLVLVRSNAVDLALLGGWLAGAEDSSLRVVKDLVLDGLESMAAAQGRIETRHAHGKIVLRVA